MTVLLLHDGTETSDALKKVLETRLAQEGLPISLRTVVVPPADQPYRRPGAERARLREYVGDPAVVAGLVAGEAARGPVRGIVTYMAPVSAAVVEAALPGLQFVSCARANPVNVDAEAARDRGVAVFHAPGRNATAVADMTMALMLAHLRHLVPGVRLLEQQPDGYWMRERRLLLGSELEGKTLGVVGFGNIGRKVVRRALAFDMRVLVHDPYAPADAVEAAGGEPAPFDQLLSRSDIVTLHVPETPETRGMVGARELDLLGPGGVLVNTARAALVDEQALVEALEQGRIAGAALDVFWEEPPPPDHPLLSMEQVTLTPHIAGLTREMPWHSARIATADIVRALKGGDPVHVWGAAPPAGRGPGR